MFDLVSLAELGHCDVVKTLLRGCTEAILVDGVTIEPSVQAGNTTNGPGGAGSTAVVSGGGDPSRGATMPSSPTLRRAVPKAADPFATTAFGSTALHIAAENGHADVCKALVDAVTATISDSDPVASLMLRRKFITLPVKGRCRRSRRLGWSRLPVPRPGPAKHSKALHPT